MRRKDIVSGCNSSSNICTCVQAVRSANSRSAFLVSAGVGQMIAPAPVAVITENIITA